MKVRRKKSRNEMTEELQEQTKEDTPVENTNDAFDEGNSSNSIYTCNILDARYNCQYIHGRTVYTYVYIYKMNNQMYYNMYPCRRTINYTILS